jgi:heme-degrading monooxygenase HmoA
MSQESMAQEVLSVAVFEPVPGQEEACLETLRELMNTLTSKGFSRDSLYRDVNDPKRYIAVRVWRSEEARRQALEDPTALRCWARMAHQVDIIRVYESLEEVKL